MNKFVKSGDSNDKNILILDNIRSSENVGSMFRTADAFGISEIVLVGITAAPLDRFARPNPKIAKTALGAEKTIPWTQYKTAEEAIVYVKEKGCALCVLEQDARATEIRPIEKSFALVVGNEVTGVSKIFLDAADIIFEIPMRGELARNRLPDDVGKESLNVSVAAGVALYALSQK